MRTLIATAASAALLTSTAYAVPVTVTVTNQQAEGGLSLTPLWLAFTDGAFDAFDAGQAASAGVEEIAEIGSVATLGAELSAAQATALGGLITAPGGFPGAPVIEPGESVSMTFELDPTDNRFVQFLAMILPSNDNFVGLDDAVALFSEDGAFLGEQGFVLTNAFAYDAGTEVNDLANGPAFVVGQDDADGEVEGGVVTKSLGIAAIAGVQLPDGSFLSPELAELFFSGDSAIASVTFSSADAIPLPGAFVLFGTAIAAVGARRRLASA